jgi:endoglucanase
MSCARLGLVRRAVAVAAIGLGLICAGSAVASDPAADVVRNLGRGINILGYDGIWDGGVDAPFKLDYLRRIRDAGFRHVRINLFAFRHMDASSRIDPLVLEALDTVVEQAIRNGLVPIIDEHDVDECQASPQRCAPRLQAFWRQISTRYAGRFPQAVFEILNEPGGNMNRQLWNALALGVLQTIRASNPDRPVIVAALNDDDPQRLQSLDLPAGDRNIILTVHYYKPFGFTHQGAPWSAETRALRDVAWGSKADQDAVAADFAAIQRWAAAHGRPVYLGEFGVYDSAAMAHRVAYASFVARAAERLGWSWAYWQFDHDFALFDAERGGWLAPLLQALMARGESPAPPR